MSARHGERHFLERVGWLRAAVLGANDGILSTASLVVGVASSGAAPRAVLLAAVAALVAGAASMAAGEYVSVSSQADSETADIAREKDELRQFPEAELNELTAIYRSRGLDDALARTVAEQLTSHDALHAHLRDELGLAGEFRARPIQAALVSAASFAAGALIPVIAAVAAPRTLSGILVGATSLAALALLGALGAWLGGARPILASARVFILGAAAMGLTALVGRLFGVAGL